MKTNRNSLKYAHTQGDTDVHSVGRRKRVKGGNHSTPWKTYYIATVMECGICGGVDT